MVSGVEPDVSSTALLILVSTQTLAILISRRYASGVASVQPVTEPPTL